MSPAGRLSYRGREFWKSRRFGCMSFDVSIEPRFTQLKRTQVQGDSPAMSSAAMSLSAPAGSPTVNWSRFALVGPGTALAALAANALCYFIAGTVVAYNAEFLPLASVGGAIIMTLAPAIVAVVLYAALLRFTRRPARIFTIISVVVFIISLIPVFTYIPTVPGVTNAQIAVLVIMHVVAAYVIVSMLTSIRRTR
jgi:hypothetical protein